VLTHQYIEELHVCDDKFDSALYQLCFRSLAGYSSGSFVADLHEHVADVKGECCIQYISNKLSIIMGKAK
jgi:hypothetical protein